LRGHKLLVGSPILDRLKSMSQTKYGPWFFRVVDHDADNTHRNKCVFRNLTSDTGWRGEWIYNKVEPWFLEISF
jgi:hypothetical protein